MLQYFTSHHFRGKSKQGRLLDQEGGLFKTRCWLAVEMQNPHSVTTAVAGDYK
jgi:hypothetical protein